MTMIINVITNSVKQGLQPAWSALDVGIQECENFHLWRCLRAGEHLENRPRYSWVNLVVPKN